MGMRSTIKTTRHCPSLAFQYSSQDRRRGRCCGHFLLKSKTSGQPQQSPPPMGNRNRPIEPSTVPGRAHYPSGPGGPPPPPARPPGGGGGRHDIIFNIRCGSGDCHVCYINIHGCKTSHKEKRKSFNFSMLLRLSYKNRHRRIGASTPLFDSNVNHQSKRSIP